MNQTCEFGRFYYLTEALDVLRCVTSEPEIYGQFGFAPDSRSGAIFYDPSDVALIPHMTSWDCDGPKHPGEGYEFIEPVNARRGDQFWQAKVGHWASFEVWDASSATVFRRRIEPDHVAELDVLFGGPARDEKGFRANWKAVKAELLALREQVHGGAS